MGCAPSVSSSKDDPVCQDNTEVVVTPPEEKKKEVKPEPNVTLTPIVVQTPVQVLNEMLCKWHTLAIEGEKTMGTAANGIIFNEFLGLMADDSEGFIKYLGTDPTEVWSKTEFIASINSRGTDQFGWNYWPVGNTFNFKSLDLYSKSAQFWATLIGQKSYQGKNYSFYMRCSGQCNLVGDVWKIVSYNLTMCLPNRFFYKALELCGYTGGTMPVVNAPLPNQGTPTEQDFINILDQSTYWAWKGIAVDGDNQPENQVDWAHYISCYGPPGPAVDPLEPNCFFSQWIGTDATETWTYPAFVDAVQPTYESGSSREYFGWSYVPDSGNWNPSSVDGYKTQGSYWATLSGFKSVTTMGITANYTFPVRMSGYCGFVPNVFLPPIPRWMICQKDLALLIPNDKFYAMLDLIYPNPACYAPLPNMPISQTLINNTPFTVGGDVQGAVVVPIVATPLGTNGATAFHSAPGAVTVGTPGQPTRALMDTGCSLCWMGSLNNQTQKNPQQAFFTSTGRNLFSNTASSTCTLYQVNQNDYRNKEDMKTTTDPALAVKKFSRYNVGAPRKPNMPLHYNNNHSIIKKQLAQYTEISGQTEAKLGDVPILNLIVPYENDESFGPWGSIESILDNDVVTLSGLQLPYIFCEAITVPSPATLKTTEFQELQNDGFVGMAFRNTDPRFPEEHITFLERVQNSSNLKMVSFDFQKKIVMVGGYDETIPTENWRVLPVRHTMLGGQYWDVLTQSVNVGGQPIINQFGTLGVVYQIFDTGASYIKLNPTETNKLLQAQFGPNFSAAVDQKTLWNNPDNADDFLGLSVITDDSLGQAVTFSFVPCYPLNADPVVVTLPISVECVYTNSAGVQTTYNVSPFQALVGLPDGNWVFGNVANQFLKMTFDDSQTLPCIWVATN